MSLEEYQKISPVFQDDIYDAISIRTCVEKRTTKGAPGVMEAAVAENRRYLMKN